MGKFMNTNIATKIAVGFQTEEIFLAYGSEQATDSTGSFVNIQLIFPSNPFFPLKCLFSGRSEVS